MDLDLDPRLRRGSDAKRKRSSTPRGEPGSGSGPPPPPGSLSNEDEVDEDEDDEEGEEEDEEEDEHHHHHHHRQLDRGQEEQHRHQQQQQQHHHDQPQHALHDDQVRKARACEACRGLKVRCEPADDDGPCKRCRRAGRSCVTTAPTRKRQKKTDSRVLELERKIDALTASLHARVALPPPPQTQTQTQTPAVAVAAAATAAVETEAAPGRVGRWGGQLEQQQQQQQQQVRYQHHHHHQQQLHQQQQLHHQQQHNHHRHSPSALHRNSSNNNHDHANNMGINNAAPRQDKTTTTSLTLTAAASPSPSPAPDLVPAPDARDIVDRGVVSVEKAAELFARYKETMVRHMPAVVFPPSTSSMELRRTRPAVFLAVMAAASSETHRLQRALHRELMQLFAYRIVIAGDKSLDLVQALHVAVVWYWPPEHFEELKFYQLVHMAAVMALDLGLGAPPRRGPGIPSFSWRPGARCPDPRPDPTTIECRRAWLVCHFFAANTAMSLHRPNLIRWSSFMSECLDVLSSSPDAAPTDQYLCHLVWAHRKADEIGIHFSMDDPGAAPVRITDTRTQYALRTLERDLEKYRASVAAELMQPTLKTSFHVLSLYMHELVLHSHMSTEQMRPPFLNTDAIRDGMVRRAEPLSPAHVDALAACLDAIAGILDTFLAMDVPAIRCLPVFNFVRVAYAVVVLMKMFFSARDPRFDLAAVIGRPDLPVDFYLDALLLKFRLTAADDRCRPAAKFLVVLAMLKGWFVKQAKTDPVDGPGSPGSTPAGPGPGPGPAPAPAPAPAPSPAPPPPQHSSLNTPLQVLSEVAMGRESTRPRRSVFASLPDIRPAPAHHNRPLFHDALSSAGDASTSSPSGPTASFTPPVPGPANLGPASSSTPPAAVAAQFASSWLDQPQPPPAWSNPPDLPVDLDLDLESLGLPMDSYDALTGGARLMLNEPWFADVFQGLPDPNAFPF